MKKLSDEELISIINAHRDGALGANHGTLNSERIDAMNHYHGRPYGDEQTGRSQVVSKDLSETIDWIMPALMKVFMQSGNLAEFIPEGEDDEELAMQESDYVNQVIMKDNQGFLVIHDYCKDALLLKNGYFKHWWDESEKIQESEYEGLTEDEAAQLLSQLEDYEILEQDERQEIITTPMGQIPVTVYDLCIRTKKKINRVRIEAVPPEELRISRHSRGSLQESPFVEHVTKKTRSDLIELGMDKEFVYSLPAYNTDETTGSEERARDSVYESDMEESVNFDKSMDEVEYCEAYVRVDYDGDGIAELRRVITCANKIPPGDEWNEAVDSVGITGGAPKRIPHRHAGESLDDDLGDLQRIKTVLTRGMLDNVYFTNNVQFLVNERVNLPDFMRSVPGGIKRVTGDMPVSEAAVPLITPSIINQILPAIDYIDKVKGNRSGINETTTGIDPDVLRQSTKGAYMENANRASQKVEMIARMLAETGIKELVLRVHELLIKHQDKARVVKLRGKYVPVNPQEWKERTDLTVKVGIGSGNEEEKREKLMLMSGFQDRLLQLGLVGPSQAFNLFSDLARALGFELPEKYAMNPESPEYQQMMQSQQGQQQPNPLAEAEQIKGQFKLESDRMAQEYKSQVDSLKAQMELQKKQMEYEAKMLNDSLERMSREAIEAARLEVSAILKGINVDVGKPGIGAGLQEGA